MNSGSSGSSSSSSNSGRMMMHFEGLRKRAKLNDTITVIEAIVSAFNHSSNNNNDGDGNSDGGNSSSRGRNSNGRRGSNSGKSEEDRLLERRLVQQEIRLKQALEVKAYVDCCVALGVPLDESVKERLRQRVQMEFADDTEP